MEDFDEIVQYCIDQGMSEDEARDEAMTHYFGGDSGESGDGDGDGDEHF